MDAAAERLRAWGAETAIVVGSGLNSLISSADDERISSAEFTGLPRPTVPGHVGQFVLSTIGGHRVIYALGRVHLYEGHSAAAVTASIRLFAECGIERVILTNAAGSLNPEFAPGSWMMIADHVNVTGATPLLGGAHFIDMADAYALALRKMFGAAAARLGFTLHEGVYAGVVGPQYETPAEVRMLQRIGADAVGMSTVLETIHARALGVQVAAFSCLTNWAAGLGTDALQHDDVLRTGAASAGQFARLLAAVLPAI